jgi:RNA polymerase-binding protein DksA
VSSIDKVRKELTWVRSQLEQRLRRIREDANHRLAPLSSDSADRAQEQENDEVLQRLEDSTVALLAQYERALARLEAGRYGTCETCGDAIDESRIELMPQSTQCLDCAGSVPK